MSKGLEVLKRLKWGYDITHEERITLCECIEKELKALEIIKKYILDDEDYLDLIVRHINIPKEEYDLLKEVLK